MLLVIYFFNFPFLFLNDFNFSGIDRISAVINRVNISPTIREIAKFLCSWFIGWKGRMKRGNKRTQQHAAATYVQEKYQRIMSLLYVNRIPSHESPVKIAREALAPTLFPFDRYFLVCGTRIFRRSATTQRRFVAHRCSYYVSLWKPTV